MAALLDACPELASVHELDRPHVGKAVKAWRDEGRHWPTVRAVVVDGVAHATGCIRDLGAFLAAEVARKHKPPSENPQPAPPTRRHKRRAEQRDADAQQVVASFADYQPEPWTEAAQALAEAEPASQRLEPDQTQPTPAARGAA
ncbi:hypothetical protein LRS10_16920 [Phenylobacterium sp. J426]|uniref:hypothetical protein n=1 Tax=Phenylobacterium sp. J426 TaxID=2898439 RepID=UPI002150DEB7|nr:hypothetical protein [Phenylobacterium sp. J426]MCR5875700.1 hypothetical protein [Phenylobacterium sp. J426]